MTPFITTLTGPSCAGKTTLEKRLKDAGFVQVISHTTREPRAGEVNGKAYYFIDKSEFKRLNATGFFIESVEFNGQYYGVSAPEVQRVADQGLPIVVIVEPEGLVQVRDYCRQKGWEVYSVFIDNPGEVIARRFLERMLGDFSQAIGKGGEAPKGVIDTYSKRLGIMLKDECYWAEDNGPACDLWLQEFNERNIDKTVEFLRQTAQQKLAA
jgi:guanylate kinase